MSIFSTLATAWKIPDVRKKLIFTMLMMVVFRLGCAIPIPGVDRDVIAQLFESADEGLFGMFDLFSGGAFSNFTIFALSITPYITASIILQLLTIAIPSLEALAREGVEGRKKIVRYTRYLTVALALIQAIGLTVGLFNSAVVDRSAFSFITIILVLTAGTAFLMWLGEQINEFGVGNGISLLIFAGIVARLPSAIKNMHFAMQEGTLSLFTFILFVVFALFVVLGIIMIQQGARKIPVQYAKRVVGRKMYGGQSTHIPIKVNQAGVIPIIFAMSLMAFPMTITYFTPNSGFSAFVGKYFSTSGNPGVWIYSIVYFILIVFFTYFYTVITFNPADVSYNMKNNGGFIPGIRPGLPTTQYLTNVMMRVTFVGAVFLGVIAVLPTIASRFLGMNLHFGGTSLLIAVGVALDLMKQIENQLVMRNYSGFLK